MRKENYMCLFFAGVAALFFMGHSVASATDTVVVIPLFTTATCTAPDEVRSAGYCWKDRNLGAFRVATNKWDAAAYGDLYQWGRPRDGHQNRGSATTDVNSDYDDPEHGDFITEDAYPFDWKVWENNNLWQGLGGINNPCPQGFRLPTKNELDTERQSWGSNNADGAYASPLNLVVPGYRSYSDVFMHPDIYGFYWSSTVSTDDSRRAKSLVIGPTSASITDNHRANGFSVRCLKD